MKKKLLSLGLAAALALSMAACGSTPAAPASSAEPAGDPVTLYVSAAASMTESLDKVIAAYEADNPNVDIVATYDSSGTLETQIQSGADCDVFISAAQKQMNELDETSDKFASEQNFVLQGTRVNILENKCVLVVAETSDKNITDWDSFQAAITSAASASDLIFAMGNSDVPVGKYTSAILENLGLNEESMVAAGVVSYGSNVKEVTEQVSSGAADCGIIYATDAYSAGMTAVAEADTELTNGPVIYPAAVMQNSANPEAAQAFLDYIQSDAAMAEFQAVGFTPYTAA